MQAGKDVIAETPVISEEVSAEIVGEDTTLNLDENEAVKRGLSKETAQKQVDKLQKGKEYRINNAARVTFTGNYNEEGMPIFINAKGNEQAYSLTNVFDEISNENGQGKLFQPNTNANNLPKNIDENSLEVVNFTNDEIEKFSQKGSVKKFYNENIQGTKITHPDSRLGEIYFYGDGANETIDKNYSKNYYILSKIKEIVEKSQYDDVENLKHPRKDGIVKFHILFGKIKTQKNINGRTVEKEQLVRIKIAEDNLGKKFFIVKPAKTYKSSSATEPNTANAFRGDNGTINIIPQSEENITPDTKLNQLKNTPKQPKIFKGAYDVSAKAIELFNDAYYSTLPHELAHFWLDNMWGYYRSGKASEGYTNNFKGVLDWLGVKDALPKRKQVGCILPVKILH